MLATATDLAVDLPALPRQKLAQDITTAIAHSLTEYGCTPSGADLSNIWISQNLHRDWIAAYFGQDLSQMADPDLLDGLEVKIAKAMVD